MPASRQFAIVASHARESPAIGREAQNLRADVRADSAPFDPARIAMLQIEAARIFPIDAELMAVMAGGDVRMASGGHVGIHANGGGGAAAGARRFARENVEFGCGLDVEQADAGAQGFADFIARLAHAGKDDALGLHSGALQAEKFAGGDDIESAAQTRQ